MSKTKLRSTGSPAGQDPESCAVSPHLERFSSSGASQGNEERPFRNPQEEAEALDRAKQVRFSVLEFQGVALIVPFRAVCV